MKWLWILLLIQKTLILLINKFISNKLINNNQYKKHLKNQLNYLNLNKQYSIKKILWIIIIILKYNSNKKMIKKHKIY